MAVTYLCRHLWKCRLGKAKRARIFLPGCTPKIKVGNWQFSIPTPNPRLPPSLALAMLSVLYQSRLNYVWDDSKAPGMALGSYHHADSYQLCHLFLSLLQDEQHPPRAHALRLHQRRKYR